MGVYIYLLTTVVVLVGYLVLKWRRTLKYWQNLGIPCEEPHILMGSLTGVQTSRSFCDVWLEYYNKFRGTGPFAVAQIIKLQNKLNLKKKVQSWY